MASGRTSRRTFIKSVGAGMVATAGAAESARASAGAAKGATRSEEKDTLAAIEAIVRERSRFHLAQRHLVVDYYRIRRKLAYPLPVPGLCLPSVPVPTIGNYPWATWMTWELEERLNALGWVAEWLGDAQARDATTQDLEALARWNKYAQYGGPDLSSAHAGRILWTAHEKWRWPSESLRKQIRAGCRRHVEEIQPGSNKRHGRYKTKDDILHSKAPHRALHNIGIIGTIGAALTAHVCGHPAAEALDRRLLALLGASLDLRAKGVVEGVAYDGYVLDFVADWLLALKEDARGAILKHPSLRSYLEESYRLAAPGAAEEVANLSDVEPKAMPFHLSAQAKLQRIRPNDLRAWHLSRCSLERFRTAGLAALKESAKALSGAAPKAGALHAHYAVVLRTGWDANDVAAAVSCSSSPMNHIQRDNGTIVIGTRGHWIVADPGYQQYMKDAEREFTIGPTAHNGPVINGCAQSAKSPRLLALEQTEKDTYRTAIDLTKCYPAKAGAASVVRTVWLSEKERVVVADRVQGKAVKEVTYHWHGHPDAAWWAEDGWALIHLDGVDVWFTSPQAKIDGTQIRRLPGSNGRLTLVSQTTPDVPVTWWAFSLSAARPSIKVSGDGQQLVVGKRLFDASC